MKKIIRRGHPKSAALFTVLFLIPAIMTGCGVDHSGKEDIVNEDQDQVNTEELTTPVLRSPANGSTIDTGNPILDWDDVPSADLFQLEISKSEDFQVLEVDEEVSSTSFMVSDFILRAGIHFWRVRAQDNDNRMSSWSSTFSFTVDTTSTLTGLPASTIKSLVPVSPDNQYTCTGYSIDLSWTRVKDAGSYILNFSGEGLNDEYLLPPDETTIRIDGLTPGEYSWSVYAADREGNAITYSEVRSFTVREVSLSVE